MKNTRQKHKKLSQSTLLPTEENRPEDRFHPVILSRQPCVYGSVTGGIYIWFHKGPYKTIGKGRWNGPPPGFCVNDAILTFAENRGLEIRVLDRNKLDRVYVTDAEKWRNLGVITHRKGIKLFCYPWSKMRAIRDTNLLRVVQVFKEMSVE